MQTISNGVRKSYNKKDDLGPATSRYGTENVCLKTRGEDIFLDIFLNEKKHTYTIDSKLEKELNEVLDYRFEAEDPISNEDFEKSLFEIISKKLIISPEEIKEGYEESLVYYDKKCKEIEKLKDVDDVDIDEIRKGVDFFEQMGNQQNIELDYVV